MEVDKNPIPEIDLFPRLTKVVHFIFDHIQAEGLSDYPKHPIVEPVQPTEAQ